MQHSDSNPAKADTAGFPPARLFWGKARRFFGRALHLLALLSAVGALFLIFAHGEIRRAAEGRIYTEISALPAADAALVLGTSKYTAGGRPNSYYQSRIKAAAELFKAGKVRGVVVSGDNATTRYNEPQRMREDLVEAGVPAAFVTCDYAGFRTLDSVKRMRAVFGMENYVIVSQDFHVARALYIARSTGQNPTGFAAPETATAFTRFKVSVREAFARGMALIDVNILGRKPKFFGEPVKVGLKPLEGEAKPPEAAPK